MSVRILGSSALIPSMTIDQIEHDILHHGGALSVHLDMGSGGAGNVIAAGGITAASTGTILFGNANNVSFGLFGRTVTAIADYPDAAVSDHIHGGVAVVSGSIGGTIASGAWSLSIPNFLTTAALSDHSHSNYVGLNTSTVTIAGTNVTLSANTNGLTFGVPKYLTSAAQISHSHGNVTTASTAGSDIKYTSQSNGLTLGIPQYITTYGGGFAMTLGGQTAGTIESINSGTVTIAGGDNITLSQDGNAFTIIGGDQSTHEHSTLPFAGTGTSVGTISGTDMVFTLNTDGLSVEHPEWVSTGINLSVGGTNTLGTLGNISDDTVMIYGGNNITLSQDNNSITILGPSTASYSAIKGIGVRDYGGGDFSTFTSGTIIFSEQTNVNIQTYLDGTGQYLRFSVADFIGTTTAATGVGLTVNASGIRISVDTAGLSSFGDGVNFLAAGTQTAGTNATVLFSNSNGVSFGMTENSIITASYTQSTHAHPYVETANSSLLQHTSATSAITSNAVNTSVTSQWLTTAAPINHTHGSLSLSLQNLSGAYSSLSNGLTISLTGVSTAPGDGFNILAAGGSTANTTGTILLSNANSVSFGFSNASAITASFSQSTHDHPFLSTDYTSHTHTYADTSHTHNYLGLASTGVTGASWTVNTSQFSLSIPQASLYYIDGNGVSWSASSSGLSTSIYASVGAGLTGGGINLAASNTTFTSGTVLLSGEANLTVGTTQLAGVQYIKLSAAAGGSGGSGNVLAVSGKTANTSGTVLFSNANGIVFGMTNSSIITASYTQSTHAHPYAGTSFSTSGITGSVFTGSLNSSGLTLGVPNIAAGNISLSAGASSGTYNSLVFSNSNNISFGLSGSTLTGSIPIGTLYFSDDNGVSFGAVTDTNNNTTVTATVGSAGTAGADGYNILAVSGKTANTTGTVLLSNANGISFGMTNSSIITADFNSSIFLQESNRGNVYFATDGAENITWGSSVNGNSTSIGATAGGGVALQGSGTYTQGTGTVQFQTGGGLTFGLTNGIITASHNAYSASSQLTGTFLTTQSNQAFSASGGSSAFQTLNFADSNGITFSNTNGSLRIVHALQYTSNTLGIADSAATITNNHVVFSNLHGVSFGLSGSTMTASVPGAGTVHFVDSHGVVFGSSTATASSYNTTVTAQVNNVWNLISAAGGSIAGTTSGSFGSMFKLAAGSGITLSGGSNGITIIGA